MGSSQSPPSSNHKDAKMNNPISHHCRYTTYTFCKSFEPHGGRDLLSMAAEKCHWDHHYRSTRRACIHTYILQRILQQHRVGQVLRVGVQPRTLLRSAFRPEQGRCLCPTSKKCTAYICICWRCQNRQNTTTSPHIEKPRKYKRDRVRSSLGVTLSG